MEAESHISTRKKVVRARALKSEAMFQNIQELATEVKMKVNQKKTQILCIHSIKDSNVTSYIETSGEPIESGTGLKILGFNFSPEPNAVCHVNKVIDKFYNRLWTLRFLKRSGMSKDRLLQVYKQIIRSGAEYCSTVYNSLIPLYMSDKLEQV